MALPGRKEHLVLLGKPAPLGHKVSRVLPEQKVLAGQLGRRGHRALLERRAQLGLQAHRAALEQLVKGV